jgi:hypothetical protein
VLYELACEKGFAREVPDFVALAWLRILHFLA